MENEDQVVVPSEKVAAEKQKFEPLPPAGKAIQLPEGVYRVYSSEREFAEIKAGSAYEAIQLSDVAEPYKVVRYELNRVPVLGVNMLKAAAMKASAAASEAAEAEIVAPPTEAEVAARDLTEDEVQALMKKEDSAEPL